MLTDFICPDQQKVAITECMEKCRMGERCLTKPTLKAVARQREWNGIPSTTQLLRGTYEAMLMIKANYAENPKESMFKLLGTGVHKGLDDEATEEGTLGESQLQRQVLDGVSGLADLLETENGLNILTDYKVSGSFKIAKALGLYFVLRETDEVYKARGSITMPDGTKRDMKPGDKKMEKVWVTNFKNQDCRDWILQLNHYRLMLEAAGRTVHMMRIQAIARDGGTMAAANWGITERVYMIPIPILPDAEVTAYFAAKRDALIAAVEMGDWDTKCSPEETWDSRKCKSFCNVREFCKFEKDTPR